MCSAGDSFVNLRSRIIASSTCEGVGLTPPLLRFISVRSVSNARWISPQYVSSSAISAGDLVPAIAFARKSDDIALSRNTGVAANPAAVRPRTNSRLLVM